MTRLRSAMAIVFFVVGVLAVLGIIWSWSVPDPGRCTFAVIVAVAAFCAAAHMTKTNSQGW